MINAEIITIGDEILIGQIVDSNSAFIGKELNKIGVEVNQITSIRDNREHILTALKEASNRAEIVLITGGLGPTKDDITKSAFVDYFGDELVQNKNALKHIEKLLAKIDVPLLQVNIDQALLPSKATALENEYGTASGMWMEKDGIVYVSLPGVPYEMKALLTDHVIPKLKHKFKRPYILHKTVLTYGMGESSIAEKIEDWENALPDSIKLAYLPNAGRVRLRLSARGENEQKLKDEINVQVVKLRELIGDIIQGYEDERSFEENIAKKLTEENKTLATAESCTGGKIASLFTDIPGASAYFKGSIVTYATSSKTDVLDIPQELIEKYSVVSAEITKEMAKRVQKLFKSDFALATTGNAGPTKGDSDAEIGTVFIALADDGTVEVREFHLGNQREKVTEKAVFKALEMLGEKLF